MFKKWFCTLIPIEYLDFNEEDISGIRPRAGFYSLRDDFFTNKNDYIEGEKLSFCFDKLLKNNLIKQMEGIKENLNMLIEKSKIKKGSPNYSKLWEEELTFPKAYKSFLKKVFYKETFPFPRFIGTKSDANTKFFVCGLIATPKGEYLAVEQRTQQKKNYTKIEYFPSAIYITWKKRIEIAIEEIKNTKIVDKDFIAITKEKINEIHKIRNKTIGTNGE